MSKLKISKNRLIAVIVFISLTMFCYAEKPIVSNQGLNDPYIHIFNDPTCVYAFQDISADNKKFVTENLCVCSSSDLDQENLYFLIEQLANIAL